MAFTYGFYNSVNGDRKYDAKQMSELFDGLITDGVFATIGEMFSTIAGEGMDVIVKTGRAWFNHTWNRNDTNLSVTIPPSDVTLHRYDAVVLEINEDTRVNRITVVSGTPSGAPSKPILTNNDTLHQYPLAYIYVSAGTGAISNSNIEIVVGQSECPFVTGIVKGVDIDDLFNQWDSQFHDWEEDMQKAFDAWFANVQSQLSGDVVSNLQRQIDEKVNKSDAATDSDIEEGTSATKWVTPSSLKSIKESIGSYTIDPITGKKMKAQIADTEINPSPMEIVATTGTIPVGAPTYDVLYAFEYTSNAQAPNNSCVWLDEEDMMFSMLGASYKTSSSTATTNYQPFLGWNKYLEEPDWETNHVDVQSGFFISNRKVYNGYVPVSSSTSLLSVDGLQFFVCSSSESDDSATFAGPGGGVAKAFDAKYKMLSPNVDQSSSSYNNVFFCSDTKWGLIQTRGSSYSLFTSTGTVNYVYANIYDRGTELPENFTSVSNSNWRSILASTIAPRILGIVGDYIWFGASASNTQYQIMKFNLNDYSMVTMANLNFSDNLTISTTGNLLLTLIAYDDSAVYAVASIGSTNKTATKILKIDLNSGNTNFEELDFSNDATTSLSNLGLNTTAYILYIGTLKNKMYLRNQSASTTSYGVYSVYNLVEIDKNSCEINLVPITCLPLTTTMPRSNRLNTHEIVFDVDGYEDCIFSNNIIYNLKECKAFFMHYGETFDRTSASTYNVAMKTCSMPFVYPTGSNSVILGLGFLGTKVKTNRILGRINANNSSVGTVLGFLGGLPVHNIKYSEVKE